ncbi:hydroxyethylthiazole kinase [Lamprocystis purpurea]|jgi:hydroxyethylthiazole kinase|uniref:hydroxyethylthiazole kinase n=1 Tax=Lamprocystis purpurea TaxID=61598 RepID=UPI0003A830CD|nr:hydroxyethylthiazole kinase [Lamprocystis purpurea]
MPKQSLDVAAILATLRARQPLVHNITNYVVMNSTANALLALGASPIMAHAIEEVEELVGISGALVLNLGTLSKPWIEAMLKAGLYATAKGIPVVLDPVGAGASRLRTDTARSLLEQVRPVILRGNASEILALGGDMGGARGVDTQHTVAQARQSAVALAKTLGMTVAVTGAEDYVTDGRREARIRNGHPLMGRVTGTGCAASAVTGAFAAVEPDAFAAATAALVVLGVAGEWAAQRAQHPGSYGIALLDGLDAVTAEDLLADARFDVEATI